MSPTIVISVFSSCSQLSLPAASSQHSFACSIFVLGFLYWTCCFYFLLLLVIDVSFLLPKMGLSSAPPGAVVSSSTALMASLTVPAATFSMVMKLTTVVSV